MSAGGTVGSEHGGHRPANGLDELGPISYYWRVTVQSNSQSNSMGGPDLVAMIDGWAGTGHGALPRRLAHALRHVVNAGVLPTGWRLPPERQLATALSVSRATITQALDELRGEGLLTSTQGSGTYVSGPTSPSPVGTRVAEHLLTGPGVDLATGNPPDLSHLPPASVDMTLLNAAGGGPGVNAFGLPAMRQAVADLYTAGRLSASPRVTTADGDPHHLRCPPGHRLARRQPHRSRSGAGLRRGQLSRHLRHRRRLGGAGRAGAHRSRRDAARGARGGDHPRPPLGDLRPGGTAQPDRHDRSVVAHARPCRHPRPAQRHGHRGLHARRPGVRRHGPAVRRALPLDDGGVRRLIEQDVLGGAAPRLDAWLGADRRADDVPPSGVRPRPLGAGAAARPRIPAQARRDRRRAAPAPGDGSRLRRRAAGGVDPRGRVRPTGRRLRPVGPLPDRRLRGARAPRPTLRCAHAPGQHPRHRPGTRAVRADLCRPPARPRRRGPRPPRPRPGATSAPSAVSRVRPDGPRRRRGTASWGRPCATRRRRARELRQDRGRRSGREPS